jgi:hypothetical protein
MLEPFVFDVDLERGRSRSLTIGHKKGGEDQGKGTELFIVWAWILRGILEDVCRAGGETTVCKDARLDLRRVDLWEDWEATRTKVRSESTGELGALSCG